MVGVSVPPNNACQSHAKPLIRHGLQLLLCLAALASDSTFLSLARAQTRTSSWISTWTASQQPPFGTLPTSFSNQTVRQIVRVSVGGDKVRIRLSNEFGPKPVLIGSASIGISHNTGVASETFRSLTFGGSKSAILWPGAPGLSDPVDLDIPPLSDVVIDLYLPANTDLNTVHQVGLQTALVSTSGDFTSKSDFPVASKSLSRFFLSDVIVERMSPTRAVVAFGDSITDGTNSSADANRRWPDVLARRLVAAGAPLAVLNQGINGNRILSAGAGISALARFERDVLGYAKASHVVVLLGINDIGWPDAATAASGMFSITDEIIAGYKQMIERAHLRGIKVIAGTLTPFENAFAGMPNQSFFSPDKEAQRQIVNKWIRTSGAFDEVIDFERVLADPSNPTRMLPDYDSGDHLHPNDAGYRAMGEAIDLNIFQ